MTSIPLNGGYQPSVSKPVKANKENEQKQNSSW